jgi:hypothetical protein
MRFIMTLLLSALFSTQTFAQRDLRQTETRLLEVILTDSRMKLAATTEGEFRLTRNSDSPLKIRLDYSRFVQQYRCIQSEMRPWWVERRCTFMGFKPGSTETLESCEEAHYEQRENCVRSEPETVEQAFQIELNFTRAAMLQPGQEETFIMAALPAVDVTFSGKDVSKYNVHIQKRFLKSPSAQFTLK